eukprot:6208401-Pleurochrysis_carterae.AAC.2
MGGMGACTLSSQMRVGACTRVRLCARVRVRVRVRARAYVLACVRVCARVCACVRVRVRARVRARTEGVRGLELCDALLFGAVDRNHRRKSAREHVEARVGCGDSEKAPKLANAPTHARDTWPNRGKPHSIRGPQRKRRTQYVA